MEGITNIDSILKELDKDNLSIDDLDKKKVCIELKEKYPGFNFYFIGVNKKRDANGSILKIFDFETSANLEINNIEIEETIYNSNCKFFLYNKSKNINIMVKSFSVNKHLFSLPDYKHWKFKSDLKKLFEESLRSYVVDNNVTSFKQGSYVPDWLETVKIFM